MTAMQMLSSQLVLLPAYGNRYATKDAMLKAWHDGVDFRMYGSGRYTSIRDIAVLSADASGVYLTDAANKVTVKVA